MNVVYFPFLDFICFCTLSILDSWAISPGAPATPKVISVMNSRRRLTCHVLSVRKLCRYGGAPCRLRFRLAYLAVVFDTVKECRRFVFFRYILWLNDTSYSKGV